MYSKKEIKGILRKLERNNKYKKENTLDLKCLYAYFEISKEASFLTDSLLTLKNGRISSKEELLVSLWFICTFDRFEIIKFFLEDSSYFKTGGVNGVIDEEVEKACTGKLKFNTVPACNNESCTFAMQKNLRLPCKTCFIDMISRLLIFQKTLVGFSTGVNWEKKKAERQRLEEIVFESSNIKSKVLFSKWLEFAWHSSQYLPTIEISKRDAKCINGFKRLIENCTFHNNIQGRLNRMPTEASNNSSLLKYSLKFDRLSEGTLRLPFLSYMPITEILTDEIFDLIPRSIDIKNNIANKYDKICCDIQHENVDLVEMLKDSYTGYIKKHDQIEGPELLNKFLSKLSSFHTKFLNIVDKVDEAVLNFCLEYFMKITKQLIVEKEGKRMMEHTTFVNISKEMNVADMSSLVSNYFLKKRLKTKLKAIEDCSRQRWRTAHFLIENLHYSFENAIFFPPFPVSRGHNSLLMLQWIESEHNEGTLINFSLEATSTEVEEIMLRDLSLACGKEDCKKSNQSNLVYCVTCEEQYCQACFDIIHNSSLSHYTTVIPRVVLDWRAVCKRELEKIKGQRKKTYYEKLLSSVCSYKPEIRRRYKYVRGSTTTQ